MVDVVGFVLAHLTTNLEPSTIRLMFFASSMSTTTAKAVMFDLDVILSFFEGDSDSLSPEDVAVKVLAKDLSCFVVNFVLRIDHDAIFSTCLVEDMAN